MGDQPAHGIAVVCAHLVEGEVAEEAVEQDDRATSRPASDSMRLVVESGARARMRPSTRRSSSVRTARCSRSASSAEFAEQQRQPSLGGRVLHAVHHLGERWLAGIRDHEPDAVGAGSPHRARQRVLSVARRLDRGQRPASPRGRLDVARPVQHVRTPSRSTPARSVPRPPSSPSTPPAPCAVSSQRVAQIYSSRQHPLEHRRTSPSGSCVCAIGGSQLLCIQYANVSMAI